MTRAIHASDFLSKGVINKAEWTLWILIKFIGDDTSLLFIEFGICDLIAPGYLHVKCI
jgi:hypothetical protein